MWDVLKIREGILALILHTHVYTDSNNGIRAMEYDMEVLYVYIFECIRVSQGTSCTKRRTAQ